MNNITEMLRERRLVVAGFYYRCNDGTASRTVLWKPAYGRTNKSRGVFTIIDRAREDLGLKTGQLETAMRGT